MAILALTRQTERGLAGWEKPALLEAGGIAVACSLGLGSML